ncbi:metallophosphoesterase [Methanomicrobium sp. W14]|uniref:metallophosphoesterase n=1 Tax=Methanomicrobium sp. W14 TaxID=2817839 RepID=UPI0032AFA47D
MMIPEFLPFGPAFVIENTIRVLVVADTHFGAETGLARHGLHIKSNSSDRLSRLMKCIEVSKCDLLVLLGDVKHSIPVTTRQEYRELPDIIEKIRSKTDFRVLPGNHDVGIEKFLKEGELLPKEGSVIDGTGYMHGHTYPSEDLLGKLIVTGHTHPVLCLYDDVGCSLKSQPAYVLSRIDPKSVRIKTSGVIKEKIEKTRVLFVPAFFELAGGIDVREIKKSGLGPLSRCIDEDSAEVFLSDGTYIDSLKGLMRDECDRASG